MTIKLALGLTTLLATILTSCADKGKKSKSETSVADTLSEPSGNILFTSTRDGNYEVYVMDASGNNPKNLSHNNATDYSLGWSPDGSHIFFYSDRSGNEEI